jgi:hypothetical protein
MAHPKASDPLGADWHLLDGRNRLDAMEATGQKIPFDRYGAPSVPISVLYGEVSGKGVVSSDFKIGDPVAFVLSANIHRRHLTADQRRDLIAKVLKAKPEASNRQIAAQVKADHKTVAAVRKAQEATGEVPQLDKTTGKDGRTRTTSPKPKTPKPTLELKPEPTPGPKHAAPDQGHLFDHEIERIDADNGLDATALRGQTKRLRKKIKALREHITNLERAKPKPEPKPESEPNLILANQILEDFLAFTVEDVKAGLLRFDDDKLEDLRRAIDAELGERKDIGGRA